MDTERKTGRTWLASVCVLSACGGVTPDASPRPHEPTAPPPPETSTAIAGVSCPEAPLVRERPRDGTPVPRSVLEAAQRFDAPLARAQASGDELAIAAAVCGARAALGVWQGVAERQADYRRVEDAPLEPARVIGPYVAALRRQLLGREPWARSGGALDGTLVSEPLRAACEIVQAYAEILPLAGEAAPSFRTAARAGADWLLRLQRAEGVFPYPDLSDDAQRFLADCAARGSDEVACRSQLPRALELALIGKQKWIEQGSPPGVLVDGWFVVDPDGGLQFDTGTCGVALLLAGEVLEEPRYIDAARRAAAWAESGAMISLNWNYNAFSVELAATLAAYERRTGNQPEFERWRTAALRRARLGVLPGALTDGRWFDPHNARIVYHHIILRGLARLAEVVDDAWVAATLDAAVRRSAEEIEAHGATAWSDGIQAHLYAQRAGRDTRATLDRLVAAAAPGGEPKTLQLASWLRARLVQE